MGSLPSLCRLGHPSTIMFIRCTGLKAFMVRMHLTLDQKDGSPSGQDGVFFLLMVVHAHVLVVSLFPPEKESEPLLNVVPEQLALNEASYTTVRLLQAYSRIKSADPEPWQEALAISCASKNGTQVILTPVEQG